MDRKGQDRTGRDRNGGMFAKNALVLFRTSLLRNLPDLLTRAPTLSIIPKYHHICIGLAAEWTWYCYGGGMEICTKLLVHAGAPSSREEDEAYIAQAEAYLAIEGTGRLTTTSTSWEARSLPVIATRVGLTGRSHEDSTTISVIETQIQSSGKVNQHGQAGSQRISAKRSRVPDSFEYIEDTQLAYSALESQLFTSSAAIARAVPAQPRVLESAATVASSAGDSRPVLRHQAGSSRVERTPHTGNSAQCTPRTSPWRRAGSAPISESSYIATPLLERTSKRVRQNSPGRVDFQPGSRIRKPEWYALPESATSGQASTPVLVQSGDENSAEGTIISDETTSELPTSYSISDLVSNSRSNSLQDRARSNSDPGPLSHSLEDNTFNPPSDSLQSQPHAVRSEDRAAGLRTSELEEINAEYRQLDVGAILKHVQEQVPHISARAFAYPDNENDVRARYDQPPANNVAEAEPDLLELAAEIHAPQPKTSVEPFKTHVTKELQSLHDLFAAKFCPVMVSRQISVHERGHWLVDCSSWRTTKKLALWRHLETWIGNGSAGWGIWCTRGADQHLVPRDSLGQASGIADTRGEFRLLRVYCWGEVIGHLYILLYTASEGSIRKLGLQWVDSKGDVVVDMKG